MKIAIAHAAWMPERQRTLARLLEQVPGAHVFRSAHREHATQWAYRAWEWAAEQDEPVCILNDDVTVCPDFVDAIHACTQAAPDRIISLHTSAPGAAQITGSSWVRCYWLTGPAYILPLSKARELLDYWASIPWEFASRRNEDNCAIHFMWERQEPAWSTIPALVTHDTETASSLGYDKHALRSSCVPWETHGSLDHLADVSYWRRGVEDPPFVENPWAPTGQLEVTRVALRHRNACHMCWQRVGLLRQGGVVICGSCLNNCVSLILKNAMVPE